MEVKQVIADVDVGDGAGRARPRRGAAARRLGGAAARVRLCLPLLCMLAGCVAAVQQPDGSWAPPASGARLVAVQDVHDFGTVENGPVVTHDFRLRNMGSDTVEIRSVEASCGCTAVLASSAYLAPGEEGGVQVALDTYRLSGEQAKSVVVRSNDPIRPELPLTLHGVVKTDVSAAPSRLFLGRLPSGAVVSHHVDVSIVRDEVQITGVHSESGRLRVETSPLDDPRRGLRVRVTLLPTARPGGFDDQIVVTTTSPRQPQLVIPVLGLVEGHPLYARTPGATASR